MFDVLERAMSTSGGSGSTTSSKLPSVSKSIGLVTRLESE